MRCTSYGDKERFRLVGFSFLRVYYTIEMLKVVLFGYNKRLKDFRLKQFCIG